MCPSQGGEDHRKAGYEDSDGGESGNVTDEISHWSLLTRYVPTLFSFCSIVNRVLLIFPLLMPQNRLRFPHGNSKPLTPKRKNPEVKHPRGSEKTQIWRTGVLWRASGGPTRQLGAIRPGAVIHPNWRERSFPALWKNWRTRIVSRASVQKSTILPSVSVTRRSMRAASS